MLPELELALFDAIRGAFAHLDHVIGMLLTQSALFPLHAGDVVAVHARIARRTQLELAEKPDKAHSIKSTFEHIKQRSLVTRFTPISQKTHPNFK